MLPVILGVLLALGNVLMLVGVILLIVAVFQQPEDIKDAQGKVVDKDYGKMKGFAISGVVLLIVGWVLVKIIKAILCKRFYLMCPTVYGDDGEEGDD